MHRFSLFVFLACLLSAGPAAAKEGGGLGAYLLFNDYGKGINSAGIRYGRGDGWGIRGSYGVNRYLAVDADLWKTTNDRYTAVNSVVTTASAVWFRALTVDIKLSLPMPESHIEPYVLAGRGAYRLDHIDGVGNHVAVGLEISLVPDVILHVAIVKRYLTLDTTPSRSAVGTDMQTGLTYYFF